MVERDYFHSTSRLLFCLRRHTRLARRKLGQYGVQIRVERTDRLYNAVSKGGQRITAGPKQRRELRQQHSLVGRARVSFVIEFHILSDM